MELKCSNYLIKSVLKCKYFVQKSSFIIKYKSPNICLLEYSGRYAALFPSHPSHCHNPTELKKPTNHKTTKYYNLWCNYTRLCGGQNKNSKVL